MNIIQKQITPDFLGGVLIYCYVCRIIMFIFLTSFQENILKLLE